MMQDIDSAMISTIFSLSSNFILNNSELFDKAIDILFPSSSFPFNNNVAVNQVETTSEGGR